MFIVHGSFQFCQLAKLTQGLVGAFRLSFVDPAQGEADMNQYVLTGLDLGNVFEASFADNTAELDLRHAKAVLVERAENLAGYGETHAGLL
jgi:hypothetical protein